MGNTKGFWKIGEAEDPDELIAVNLVRAELIWVDKGNKLRCGIGGLEVVTLEVFDSKEDANNALLKLIGELNGNC